MPEERGAAHHLRGLQAGGEAGDGGLQALQARDLAQALDLREELRRVGGIERVLVLHLGADQLQEAGLADLHVRGQGGNPGSVALEELLSVLLLAGLPPVPEPEELLAAWTWVTSPRGMEWCDIVGP